jgi:hypothetical protein
MNYKSFMVSLGLLIIIGLSVAEAGVYSDRKCMIFVIGNSLSKQAVDYISLLSGKARSALPKNPL